MRSSWIILIAVLCSCVIKHANEYSSIDADPTQETIEPNDQMAKGNADISEYNKHVIPYMDIDYSTMMVKYHSWEPTASSPLLTKWNIEPTETEEFFIQETVDRNNRTIELKFMESKNKIYADMAAFDAPIIRFYYHDNSNQITVCYYDALKIPYCGFEAGLSTQMTFSLNERFQIVGSEVEVYISSDIPDYYDSLTIINGIKEIKEDSDPQIIYDYYYSDSKLNGMVPMKEGYDRNKISLPYAFEVSN